MNPQKVLHLCAWAVVILFVILFLALAFLTECRILCVALGILCFVWTVAIVALSRMCFKRIE